MGPERLHYEYSAALPQVHLTLVSVLQGIAFALLLLSIPLPGESWCVLPNNNPYPMIVNCIMQQHVYLAFIVSSLLILLIWGQFVYASMFEFWSFSPLQMGLVFLLSVAEIMTFKVIIDLQAWLIGLGFIGLFGGFIRFSNVVVPTKDDFESQNAAQVLIDYNRRDGFLYVLAGALLILLGIMYRVMDQLARQYFPQGAGLLPWFVLGSLFVSMMVLWILGSRFRYVLLLEIARGSDLTVTPRGIVRYKGSHETTESNEFHANVVQQSIPWS
jgi:hypothetical protein